ncbi:hypothetical protein F6X40_11440 [Paraburkholderia sp. UCT31]|uniref:restriction endonuclease subunit S n=1 Tax=Paraburkholderia sp. UCT31 TaxID=2615209 RepID=UPI00165606C7|nr:restriction endonuclease subunit S [Paraburkholderia sp. UCT31]MBC8737418.1 hypothetical protein [Paraburkholderia sp. UCT31]
MPSNRIPYILYDIAEFINGRACASGELGEKGFPVIKIGELNNGIGPSTKHLASVPLDKHRIDTGDLLFAWSASVGIYHWTGGPAVLNQHIFKVQAREMVHQGYLRYLLTWLLPTFEGIVADQATTMGHVKVADLKKLFVELPDKTEQSQIASVLGTLDDRIENLRATNKTLEAIVQTLFKSWFVEFDPVKAKVEGRAPAGMDAETAALFPSEFEDSELGPTPKGWAVDRLQEHLEVERGLSYKGAGLCNADEGVPMHNLNSIFEGGGYKYAGLKHYKGDYKAKHTVVKGDILVANTEQGHEHRLIGSPAIVPRRYSDGIFSQHVYRVRFKAGSPLETQFLFWTLRSPAVREQIIGCCNGSTVNMLSRAGLEIPQFRVPPRRLISKFEEIAASTAAVIEHNIHEQETLSAFRDSLLPKLISGAIRLPDFRDNCRAGGGLLKPVQKSKSK